MKHESESVEKIKRSARLFDEAAYAALLEDIGDAQIVLLGEATHGTHEFYMLRAEISKKLIHEKHFNIIAIEGDWPDAYQINNYILGETQYKTANQALASFDKFPTWMWQNVPVTSFVEWLKSYNAQIPEAQRIHFYGLDLYSLYKSIDTIITHLEKIDTAAAAQARHNYACLEQFRQDPTLYGYSVFKPLKSCQEQVMAELNEMGKKAWHLIKEKKLTENESFYLLQNARVVKNAEAYYRTLFFEEVNNWNLRDAHMMETVMEITRYYTTNKLHPKIIIWAHNSHIGNAAATQMASHGEFNIGQLVKEQFNKKAYSVGFTTYNGTVSAASDWHMPVERKIIRDALPKSYEHLFHQVGISPFLLLLSDKNIVPSQLLERAIGVVYAPHTERQSHYFYASLAQQFDAVIHYDTTSAVEPLEKSSMWIEGEAPEAYPSGL